MSAKMKAKDVVSADLQYVCENLREELASLSGNKLLITGGAGFLGYYLVQTLLYWNDKVRNDRNAIDVTVCDNYIRGIPAWLAQLEGTDHLSLVKADITTVLPQDLGRFSHIIHAASIASPTYYRKYPIETMDANVGGLHNLLAYFRNMKRGNQKTLGFLFFSSSEIYG